VTSCRGNRKWDRLGRRGLISIWASSSGLERYAWILFLSTSSYSLFSKLLESNPPDDKQLSEGLDNLRTALYAGSGPQKLLKEHRICASDSEDIFIDILIAFDEAQTLATTVDASDESRFVVVRRKLLSLSSYPLFTFFLATAGKITQFARPRGRDSSTRINTGELLTPRPYIYLGFDQLMQGCKVFEQWKTLDDVTSLECAAHMGRPL
jgi:hypothetical protein